MGQSIKEVMTPEPVTLPVSAPLTEAARAMRESDIGDVIVIDDSGKALGLVTDRDIVIRALADGRDPEKTPVGDIASTDLVTLSSDSAVEDAISLMRGKAVRRIVVTEGDQPVGIVSIGDLAIERDADSALADISRAEPDR
ncbi:MAG: CBS domain-containing protein [Actinomycetota bacterium]